MFDIYTIPATASQLSVLAARFEAAVYTADDYFQAHIAPRAIPAAIWALQICFKVFVQAVILTYAAGVKCGRWYRAWFASYCAQPVSVEVDAFADSFTLPEGDEPIEAEIIAPVLLLPPAPATFLLMPAVDVDPAINTIRRFDRHAARQSQLQIVNPVLITPSRPDAIAQLATSAQELIEAIASTDAAMAAKSRKRGRPRKAKVA